MHAYDTQTWMLQQALELMQDAERLQRQFFRLAPASAGPCWEPPVDLVQHGRRFKLLVALPGVPSDRFEVRIEQQSIVVRGERALEDDAGGAILRLEIPYGRFERRISLPPGTYRVLSMALEHGCLRLALEQLP